MVILSLKAYVCVLRSPTLFFWCSRLHTYQAWAENPLVFSWSACNSHYRWPIFPLSRSAGCLGEPEREAPRNVNHAERFAAHTGRLVTSSSARGRFPGFPTDPSVCHAWKYPSRARFFGLQHLRAQACLNSTTYTHITYIFEQKSE